MKAIGNASQGVCAALSPFSGSNPRPLWHPATSSWWATPHERSRRGRATPLRHISISGVRSPGIRPTSGKLHPAAVRGCRRLSRAFRDQNRRRRNPRPCHDGNVFAKRYRQDGFHFRRRHGWIPPSARQQGADCRGRRRNGHARPARPVLRNRRNGRYRHRQRGPAAKLLGPLFSAGQSLLHGRVEDTCFQRRHS